MKIVFIGGGSGFSGALLDHLHREGNDMYWISPQKPSHSLSFAMKCTHFPFHANDPGIPYVLESIGADAVVYLGAYDDTLRFHSESSGGESMMGELSSLLSLTDRFHIKQFVLLSSEEVFGAGADHPLTEEDVPTPLSLKGEFLASAERMLTVFSEGRDRKTLVIRLGNVFGPQVSMPGSPGYVLSMCAEAVQSHTVHASPHIVRQPVFIADAVEGVWALMSGDAVPSGLYHIAGNDPVSDAAVALRVVELIPGATYVEENTQAHLCLSSAKAAAAAGFHPKHALRESLDQTISWAQRYLARNNDTPPNTGEQEKKTTEKPRGMLRTLLDVATPYLENILLLILSAAATIYFRDNAQLDSINFLLVYVVIVGALSGKLQAALATLMATAVHLYVQADGGSMLSAILQYGQFLNTGVMFALGMLVGHVRDRFALEEQSHRDELEHQRQQYDELMVINEANMSIKNALEQRLLGYGDSFAKIISIISELDMMEPQRVLQASLDVVRRIMRTEDVSIYQVAERGYYARLAASSSPASRALGKSIRLENYPDMYAVLQAGDVYVNRSLSEGYPLMAAPVMVGERMVNIIMLWNMEFEQLSPANINLLSVMARLVSSSADRAYRHNQALRRERYIDDTYIMTPEAFREMLSYQQMGLERGIHDYTVLQIDADHTRGIDLRDLSLQLSAALRDSDIIGMDEAHNVLLLLASTSAEDAGFVIERLARVNLPAKVVPNDLA